MLMKFSPGLWKHLLLFSEKGPRSFKYDVTLTGDLNIMWYQAYHKKVGDSTGILKQTWRHLGMTLKQNPSDLLFWFISFKALLFFKETGFSFVVLLQYLDAFIERNTWGENLLFFMKGMERQWFICLAKRADKCVAYQTKRVGRGHKNNSGLTG